MTDWRAMSQNMPLLSRVLGTAALASGLSPEAEEVGAVRQSSAYAVSAGIPYTPDTRSIAKNRLWSPANMILACSTASQQIFNDTPVGVLLNDDSATTPTDHSSGRASPHRIINPRKPPRSTFSLTPFLTRHKAGRVPFRFRSARVGWPAFRRNPVCAEKPIRDRSSLLRGCPCHRSDQASSRVLVS
jgi:hypothetical protein